MSAAARVRGPMLPVRLPGEHAAGVLERLPAGIRPHSLRHRFREQVEVLRVPQQPIDSPLPRCRDESVAVLHAVVLSENVLDIAFGQGIQADYHDRPVR